MCVCMNMYVCVYEHVCVCVCVYEHACVCVCVCVLEVKFVCMSQTHIVACSSEGVFVWHYRTTSRLVTELTHVSTKKGRDMQDRLFHIDLGGGVSQTVDFTRVAKVNAVCINIWLSISDDCCQCVCVHEYFMS